MIGDTSATSSSPAGPASTGQHRCCRHSRAAVSSSAGGSVIDTNAPPVQPSSRWAPRNDRRVAASRRGRADAVDPTAAVRRRPPSPPGVRRRPPRSAAVRDHEPQPRHPVDARHGDGRQLHRRDQGPASPDEPTGGHAVGVHEVGDLLTPVDGDRAPHDRAARPADGPSSRGTSCSTASSQDSQRCPSTCRSATGTNLPVPSACSTIRACSCRKRSVTVTCGPRLRAAPATRRAISGSSPTPAAAAPGGPRTPNCHRDWFLPALAR